MIFILCGTGLIVTVRQHGIPALIEPFCTHRFPSLEEIYNKLTRLHMNSSFLGTSFTPMSFLPKYSPFHLAIKHLHLLRRNIIFYKSYCCTVHFQNNFNYNQQLHLYNFHIKSLRHVSIFLDHHQGVVFLLAKVML